MKLLNLSLDNSALDKTSTLAGRLIEYGELADKYTVLVPCRRKQTTELSAKAKVYGSGGNNKLSQLNNVYNLAKKIIKQEKYNVITVQDPYFLALLGLLLSKKYQAGLEAQVHGFEKFYGWRRLIAGYVLKRANAVRCVSQRLKRQLIDEFNVDEERITVVPIHSQLATRNSQLANREDKKFIFLTVGRLVKVKNIGLQIEAMRQVVKKHPATELWIVGDGPEKKNYELNDNIKPFGWQNDLAKYYNLADAFLLTSNSEGWGLAVIEAAASGLPIIMTDVGCAGEVIENNKSGLVIPVGDGKALEQAMSKIIEDKKLRETLAAGARQAISKLPNEAECLKLYQRSWQKAASGVKNP